MATERGREESDLKQVLAELGIYRPSLQEAEEEKVGGDHGPAIFFPDDRLSNLLVNLLPKITSNDPIDESTTSEASKEKSDQDLSGSDLQVVGLGARAGGDVSSVTSYYLPFDSPDQPPSQELKNLVEFTEERGQELLVGCNSNAHHRAWESKNSNERGTIVDWYRSSCVQTSPEKTDSKLSQTSDNSTFTLKSEYMEEVRSQILKLDKSSSSILLFDQLTETNSKNIPKKCVTTASNTTQNHRLWHRCRFTKCPCHLTCKNMRRNDMRLYEKTDGYRGKVKPSDRFQRTPFDLTKTTPFVPAERESCSTLGILSDGTEKSSNKPSLKYSTQEDSMKGDMSGDQCRSNISSQGSTRSQESENVIQSHRSDQVQSVTSRVRGDIINNVEKLFRSTASNRITFKDLNMRRSRSDTSITLARSMRGLRKSFYFRNWDGQVQKSYKTGKPSIFWAITKINIYPDNSRTYEVMPLTGKKPSEVPDRSDSVFVLIPPKKDIQTKVAHE